MTVLSFGQRRNLAPVAPDQRHLLGAAPSLDPSFRFQCFETCREFLAPDESDRQFVSGKAGYHTRQIRSEEHTSELQSLMRISYAVFCLKKKKNRLIQRLSPTH